MLGRGAAWHQPAYASHAKQQAPTRATVVGGCIPKVFLGRRLGTGRGGGARTPRSQEHAKADYRPAGEPGVMLTSKVFDPGFTSNESVVAVL